MIGLVIGAVLVLLGMLIDALASRKHFGTEGLWSGTFMFGVLCGVAGLILVDHIAKQ